MTTTAAAAKTPVQAAPEAAPKKKKNKVLLIGIVLAVVLAAAAAGAAWFLMAEDGADGEPKISSKPPVFLPVDQFTVNLQPEDGQQYLQVAMTLKLADQNVADAIKTQMPEMRSRVLLLLSSKKPSQLLTVDGKTRLTEEIAREVEAALAPEKPAKTAKTKAEPEGKKAKAKASANGKDAQAQAPAPARVLAVYFTHFIVQ